MNRLIVVSEGGQTELNFMWLPVWLGMDPYLREELEKYVAPKIEGRELTDDTLDEAHEHILDFFEQRYPALVGLRDYLDAMKLVTTQ